MVKPRLHERLFALAGDAIFFKLCRVASARWKSHVGDATGEKIARKKSPEIVDRVATLQLFARACDATTDYLANEIKVGISVYSALVS